MVNFVHVGRGPADRRRKHRAEQAGAADMGPGLFIAVHGNRHQAVDGFLVPPLADGDRLLADAFLKLVRVPAVLQHKLASFRRCGGETECLPARPA